MNQCSNCGFTSDAVFDYPVPPEIEPSNGQIAAVSRPLCYFCARMDRSLLGLPLAAHISYCTNEMLKNA